MLRIKVISLLAIFVVSCADLQVLSTKISTNKSDLVSIAENPQFASKTLQASQGKNKAILVHSGINANGHEVWKGLDGIILTTNKGRLTSALGLDVEMRGHMGLSLDPLVTGDYSQKTAYLGQSDYMPNYIYGAKNRATFSVGQEKILTVLGVRKRLVNIKEKVFFVQFNQTRMNSHWVDRSTGNVWKSKQHYSPRAKPVILERVFSVQSRPMPVVKQNPQTWSPDL